MEKFYDDGYSAFYASVPYDSTQPRPWQNGWLDAESAFVSPDYDCYEEDMDYGE